MVALMIVTKTFTNDKDLPYKMQMLTKLLIDLRNIANKAHHFDPNFIPICILFLKEFLIPFIKNDNRFPYSSLNPKIFQQDIMKSLIRKANANFDYLSLQ